MVQQHIDWIKNNHSCNEAGVERYICKPKEQQRSLRKCLLFITLVLAFQFFYIQHGIAQPIRINSVTTAFGPVNSILNNYVASGNVRCMMRNIEPLSSVAFVPVGRIERISPSPFTIRVRADVIESDLTGNLVLGPGVSVNLMPNQLVQAFSFFNINELEGVNVDLLTLLDGGNIKLPPGIYQICFDAYDTDYNGGIAMISNPAISCATFEVPADMPVNAVNITTNVIPPANPSFYRYVMSGGVKPVLQYINPMGTQVPVKIFGKIESLSPQNFTVALNPDYNLQPSVTLMPGVPMVLTPYQVNDAFGGFRDNNLITSGISIEDLMDNNNNFRLPEGLYNVCFYARYDSLGLLGGNASNPSLGCATVIICYKASAPQLTQPVNNFNISEDVPTVSKASPLIFAWTKPGSTCGLNAGNFTYDFEIREVYPNQTVTDAVHNPPVFFKTGLNNTTFLLDTILYNRVLQDGGVYIVRVRANTPLSSGIEIDNNGLSREQIFRYGGQAGFPLVSVPEPGTVKPVREPVFNSTIATSLIRGKILWAFKQSEETYQSTRIVSNNISLQGVPSLNSGGNLNTATIQRAIDPNALRQNLIGANNSTGQPAVNQAAPPGRGNTQPVIVVTDGDVQSITDENAEMKPGNRKHPLSNASIFIYGEYAFTLGSVNQPSGINKSIRQGNFPGVPSGGVKSSQGQPERKRDLLASGTSAGNGDVVINFIDPKFRNIIQYERMIVEVSHSSFEKVQKTYSVVKPDMDGKIDLGEIVLAANTYRFTPVIKNKAENMGDVEVTLFCDAEVYHRDGFYKSVQQGVANKVTVAGKEYIQIASVKDGYTINQLFYNRNNADKYLVRFSSDMLGERYSHLGVIPNLATVSNSAQAPGGIIKVKAAYRMRLHHPVIMGNAGMIVNDNKQSLAGAVIRVEYDAKDVAIHSTLSAASTGSQAVPQRNSPFAVRVALNNSTTSAFQTTTDSSGNFRIDQLPILKPNSKFTVILRTNKLPGEHSEVADAMGYNDSAVTNFSLRPELVTVTGIVVDKDSATLGYATLAWKSSPNNRISAGPDGLFTISNLPGGDSLIISRIGYKPETIFVNLPPPARNNNPSPGRNNRNTRGNSGNKTSNAPAMPSAWVSSLFNQPSVKQSTGNGSISGLPAALGLAIHNNTPATQAQLMQTVLQNGVTTENAMVDVGSIGYLEKIITKVEFSVYNNSNLEYPDVAGAKVVVGRDTFTTALSGKVLVTGLAEGDAYIVIGPSGSNLVTYRGDVGQLKTDGSVTRIPVFMRRGHLLTGNARSGNNVLEGVEVFVDELDYIQSYSRADGTYALVVPADSSVTIKATKRGYVGAAHTQVFTSNVTHDFELTDGGGRNISSLLGFEIILEKREVDGQDEIWTGSFSGFVMHQGYNLDANFKIKFSNLRVAFDQAGDPIVLNDEVVSDVSEIAMKLFDFLPVKIKASGGGSITIRLDQNGIGVVDGKWELNTDIIPSLNGFAFSNTYKPFVVPANVTDIEKVPLFKSNGAAFEAGVHFSLSYDVASLRPVAHQIANELESKLEHISGSGKAALEQKLNEIRQSISASAITSSVVQYTNVVMNGFEGYVDISKCVINNNGISLTGMVTTPEMGVIHSLVFNVRNITVSPDFEVTALDVETNVDFGASMAGWSAQINVVAFNLSHFKIGGTITVPIPQSEPTIFTFSNVEISKDGVTGGSFNISGSGINVFSVVTITSGDRPVTFGRVGNTEVYKISGSARIRFNTMFNETFEIPYFEVRTDGTFAIEVPVNQSLSTGFASYHIKSLTVNTTGNQPSVYVNGDFSVEVEIVRISAGGITFRKGRNGDVEVSVDRLSFTIDIPGVVAAGYLTLEDNGFAGGGKLAVQGTPLDLEVHFHYYKLAGGHIDVGADFKAGVVIPIGAITITEVLGGFKYNSATDFFSVTIGGGVSVASLDALIELDSLALTIESSGGNVRLLGTVGVKVATIEIARASVELNLADAYFAINILSNITPVEGLLSSQIEGALLVSGKQGDTYVFLGARMNIRLLGLLDSEGDFALGINVANVKNRDRTRLFVEHLPSDYLFNGRLTGVYLSTRTAMGINENNADEYSLGFASVKAWAYANSRFHIYKSFESSLFKINANLNLEGGLEARAGDLVAGSSVAVCAYINGGYSDAKGWHFDVDAKGSGNASIGTECNCNSVCLLGLRICKGLKAQVRFESNNGGLRNFKINLTDNMFDCD